MIEASGTFSRVDGVLAQEAHGETVLLRLGDGSYYTLDEVGSVAWDLCDGRTSVDGMVSAICASFDVEPDLAFADLVELLSDLVGERLLKPGP